MGDMDKLPVVQVIDGVVRATSSDVAEAFGKDHKHVLRSVDSLLRAKPELCGRNFAPTSISVAGPNGAKRQTRAFAMDRDGFSLLVMGFTGPKALDWKLAYIEAFNRMEAALKAAAANDGLAMMPSPYLGTPDDVSQIRTAVLLVRECKDLFGQQAGRQMWSKLGFPVPDVDLPPAPSAPGEPRGPVEGDIHAWAMSAGVDPSRRQATSISDLFDSYSRWCGRRGHHVMHAQRFKQAMVMLFGTEEHPEMIRVVMKKAMAA